MNPLSERQNPKDGVGLVQFTKLMQNKRVALSLRVEGDAALNGLRREEIDFLADAVVGGLQNAAVKGLPGVARDHGRKIGLVDFGKGLGAGRFLEPGDGQYFVTIEILMRKQ